MDLPFLFLLRRRDADHGQSVPVAQEPAVQAQAEGFGIASVGFDFGILFVEPLRGDDPAVHPALAQLAAEAKAKPTGLIDHVNGISLAQEAVDPGHEFPRGEAARGFRRGVIVLGYDDVFALVYVQSKLDFAASLVRSVTRLWGGRCG
ncbi:MAG TPA: hypothetical protein VIS99_04795 [Terrimicrobiaceae bacterium]